MAGIQFFVPSCIAVFYAKFISGEVLPFVGMNNCSSGNGGAFLCLFFGLRMILTVVKSSSSTNRLHGRN